MIKRSPDALTQMNINISNAEVRIGAVEQNATHRIEVIRTEMSRALHDHKERTDRIIDQLTARVAQLEAGHDLTDPRRFGMIGRNSSISVTTAPMSPGPPICRQCPDRFFAGTLAARLRDRHCWVRSTMALRPVAMLHRLTRPQLCSLRRAV